jgi:hypothetical protein
MVDPLITPVTAALAGTKLGVHVLAGFDGLKYVMMIAGAHAISERWTEKLGVGAPNQMLTELGKLHGKFDAEAINDANAARRMLTMAINTEVPINRRNLAMLAFDRFNTLVDRTREALRVWGRWGNWHCLQLQGEPVLATHEALDCMRRDPVVGGFVFGPAYKDTIYDQYNGQIKQVLSHPHRRYRTEKDFDAYINKLVSERGYKEFMEAAPVEVLAWGSLRLAQGVVRLIGLVVDDDMKAQKNRLPQTFAPTRNASFARNLSKPCRPRISKSCGCRGGLILRERRIWHGRLDTMSMSC